MAQKQIFRDGNRLGFLPWGTPGRRLGAARWTDLLSETGRTPPPLIKLACTDTHRLPEIPTLFRHNTNYELPKFTLGAHFTEPKPITWIIDAGSSESNLQDYQLSVKGAEESHFVLSAMVSEEVIQPYECQIEERETVHLSSITIIVKPIVGHDQEGMCNFFCKQENRVPRPYEADSRNMELRIGNEIHHPNYHKITALGNSTLSFDSSFTVHLSKLPLDESATAKASWYTDSQVFNADVKFDYSGLQLESISSEGNFSPSKILLTDLYFGDVSEEISSLDLSIGRTILHRWPVSFTITTPIQTKKIKQITTTQLTIPIKRGKIQEWFDSPPENEHHRSITLTPNIAGLDLPRYTSIAQLHLEIPEAPRLGYRGDRTEGWIKFLLRPQEEYHTIQRQLGIGGLFIDQNWRDEISPEKLSSMKRNNIYRFICEPIVDPPNTNCPRVVELLSSAYKCLDDRVETPFGDGQQLAGIYGGSKVIDVESTAIQFLYSRQKFTLVANGSQIYGDDPRHGRSFNQEGESISLLRSNGTSFTPQGGDTGFDFDRLPEAFAYKTNNNTFTAPQTPGVYYLYVPARGDHYLVEIEVHGFIEEAIE